MVSQMFGQIISKEKDYVEDPHNFSLQNGKMGRALFFLWYAKIFNDTEWKEKGESLIDDIYNILNVDMPLNINEGLIGIGLGLYFLIQNNYVKGDPDIVLKDIDEYLFKIIAFEKMKNNSPDNLANCVDILIYLSCRLKDGMNDPMERNIYSYATLDVLNFVYQSHSSDFYEEPLPFDLNYHLVQFLWSQSTLYKIGIYKERIKHILKEMQIYIFSQIPLLHSNRLLLFYVINRISIILPEPRWKQYANFLYQNISIENIINAEICDKSMFLSNGLSGIYLLLKACNKQLNVHFPYNPNDLLEKIKQSEVWSLLNSDKDFFEKYSGLDGYCGLAFIIYQLTIEVKHYE